MSMKMNIFLPPVINIDDEILAYLTGWIYENLNKQINRKKV